MTDDRDVRIAVLEKVVEHQGDQIKEVRAQHKALVNRFITAMIAVILGTLAAALKATGVW